METDELPKINLPGDAECTSYQKALKEYCIKKEVPRPKYEAVKETDGLVGNVSFSGISVKCEEKSENGEEAQARVAFKALQHLGYLRGEIFKGQYYTGKPKRLSNRKRIAIHRRKKAAEHDAMRNAEYIDGMETNKLPKIPLPGEEKFQSYKNSLREYCEKKKVSLPQYTAEKETDGVVGIVSFSDSYVKCKEKSTSFKEADLHAAFDALQQLGYLRGKTYEATLTMTCRDELYEISQNNGWGAPTYNTTRFARGFLCTVTINNTQFKSLSAHHAKTPAKDDAAKVALSEMRVTGHHDAMETYELPTIPLPGDKEFLSYRDTLQEYCEKKKIPAPRYFADKVNGGLVGTVSFSGCYVKCKEKSETFKEADSHAAFEALQQIGYLIGETFEVQQNELKRKGDDPQTNAKQFKPDTILPSNKAITPKNELYEISQNNGWTAPTYNTVSVPGGFFSTVTINNTQFKSMSIHMDKMAVEHDAAEVALNTMRSPLPAAQIIPAAQKIPPTKINFAIGVKNRLQQYCEKTSKELPRYETKRDGPQTYQTNVTVDGVEYPGSSQVGKKRAETAAAEVALMELMRKGLIV